MFESPSLSGKALMRVHVEALSSDESVSEEGRSIVGQNSARLGTLAGEIPAGDRTGSRRVALARLVEAVKQPGPTSVCPPQSAESGGQRDETTRLGRKCIHNPPSMAEKVHLVRCRAWAVRAQSLNTVSPPSPPPTQRWRASRRPPIPRRLFERIPEPEQMRPIPRWTYDRSSGQSCIISTSSSLRVIPRM